MYDGKTPAHAPLTGTVPRRAVRRPARPVGISFIAFCTQRHRPPLGRTPPSRPSAAARRSPGRPPQRDPRLPPTAPREQGFGWAGRLASRRPLVHWCSGPALAAWHHGTGVRVSAAGCRLSNGGLGPASSQARASVAGGGLDPRLAPPLRITSTCVLGGSQSFTGTLNPRQPQTNQGHPGRRTG